MHPKTGMPRPAALTHAETIGLSVFREERATDDEIRGTALRLVENARANQDDIRAKKIGVFGVLRMSCNTIRTEVDPVSGTSAGLLIGSAAVPTS
jgi:hypothetical protein